MSLPILTLVFDRKKTSSKEKAGVVELRMTYGKERKYLSTGVKVLPKEWKDGRIVRRADADELQDTLEILLRNIRKVFNKMLEEGSINLSEVKPMLDEMLREKGTFLDYMAERNEIRKYGKSEDTKERYDRFMRFMVGWGKIVRFSDVTDTKVLELDRCLTKKGMKPYSKWNNYHRFLNSFILDAIDDGFVKRNPYKWLHIEKEKTCGIKKFLTADEMTKIKKATMPTQSLERVRDLFVFQTYTCMSYADLVEFDVDKIERTGESLIYTSKRKKTQQEFTFVILRPAREILAKYKNRLPVISNMKYNDYLKLVAQSAGIDKPITSHWARHTGATMLLNDGKVDMEIIAKILGHSSTKQTRETYAALLKGTIADAMKDFDKKL